MVRIILTVYKFLFMIIPFGVTATPFLFIENQAAKAIYVLCFPILLSLCFLLTCGGLSRPFRKAIKKGRFNRKLDDPVYGPRSVHATCWTSTYYSPFYSWYLSIPWFRKLMLRLFGYQGNLNFTFYPDTWIRDLPILNVDSGVYLSNKSTIGTNLALQDGRILVDGIRIGKNSMIGHLTMVAAGTRIGDESEVSHGVACGAKVNIGNRTKVNPTCTIDHAAMLKDEIVVGTYSYVGLGAKISSGIELPAGSNIPRRANICSQEDVSNYLSSETQNLNRLREELINQIDPDLAES